MLDASLAGRTARRSSSKCNPVLGRLKHSAAVSGECFEHDIGEIVAITCRLVANKVE
jgi:hypothetical protein